MILGDDDVISRKYLDYCRSYLNKGYDYITNNNWNTIILEDKILASMRYIKRPFPDGLGAGRVISKRVLEAHNYNIYDFSANDTLDGISFNRYFNSINKIHYTNKRFYIALHIPI